MLEKPYKGNEKYVFISYSHKNTKDVQSFIEQLQRNGYNVWYDEGIDPGTEWDENIAGHIRGCSYFIAYVTNDYVNSQNCKDELTYARDLNKERLLVYGEEVELPEGMKMRMNRLQAIFKYKYKNESDFYNKVFETKGIDSCRTGTVVNSDLAPINTAQISTTKTINKKIIVIGAVIVLALIVGIIALTNMNKSTGTSSSADSGDTTEFEVSTEDTDVSETVSDDSSAEPDKTTFEEKTIKNGINLKWDTGDATLTGYSTETVSGKPFVTLFFDYTNPDSEPNTMMNNAFVHVFQNGVEMEYNGDTPLSTVDIEDRSFARAQKGGTIHCAESFYLDEPKGTITILVEAFNKDFEEVSAEQELTIK